ncbi:conjugative plasmid protein (pARN3) [Sulfuracidifex tepidarius]|nr:conjugative plasmid protein (pARN3) [Sulfuracidifex tepidarius]
MRKFNYNEIVVLNPLQTRYQMMSSRVFIPLYAAANDGIYRMNRRKFVTKYGPKTIGMYMLGAFGALILLIGIGIVAYPFTSTTGMTSADGLIAIVIGGLMLYFARKNANKLNQRISEEKGMEGEIVVPWSQVKTITVMNVRQENVANRPSLVLNTVAPTYKEIGDWHVLTTDGNDIIIPNVDDPYNKLNYVKNRFNLNFS